MGHPDYRNCKRCGLHSDEPRFMSWTRLCPTCSKAELLLNIDSLKYHRGPAFRRWRRGMAASVGGVLVDDILREANTG